MSEDDYGMKRMFDRAFERHEAVPESEVFKDGNPYENITGNVPCPSCRGTARVMFKAEPSGFVQFGIVCESCDAGVMNAGPGDAGEWLRVAPRLLYIIYCAFPLGAKKAAEFHLQEARKEGKDVN